MIFMVAVAVFHVAGVSPLGFSVLPVGALPGTMVLGGWLGGVLRPRSKE